MSDLNLDDLIKQDREKAKAQRVKPHQNKQNRFSKPQGAKNPQNNKPKWENNQEKRQERPNFKGKPIHKQGEGKFVRKQEREQVPQRKQKQQPEGQKLFRTLKVLGLSPELTNEDLYKLFAAEGSLEKCLIEQDNFGRSLATAIVKYHNSEAAKSAIHNLNRHKIMNCVLTVEPYKNQKPE